MRRDVCVVASPDGRGFIDVDMLEERTGHPVRSYYKKPGTPDVLPPTDAMIAAPLTCNSMAKWAAGISDTLPLGLLVEAVGKGLPVAADRRSPSATECLPVATGASGELLTHPPTAGRRNLMPVPDRQPSTPRARQPADPAPSASTAARVAAATRSLAGSASCSDFVVSTAMTSGARPGGQATATSRADP